MASFFAALAALPVPGPALAAAAANGIMMAVVFVLVLGAGAQWLAWRFNVPSILLLLTFGFLAGPVTGLIPPSSLQGDWVFAFVSLSIGVILFEGGLTLRLSELREVGRAVLNLITLGVLVTWALAGLAAYYVLGFAPGLAVLTGAILTVTGPTVVTPLLRYVRPTGRVGTAAKWEGITIDPVGAILAVLVLETILFLNHTAEGTGSALLETAHGLLLVVVVGVGVSALGAALLTLLIRRGLLPDYLQNAIALMIVVAAFAVSNLLQEESGLLTTTLMGIFMANQPYVSVRRLAEFKEDLQVLLVASLFILLSARLELSVLEYIDGRVFLFLALLILVVRPVAVWISSLGTQLDWKEWGFLSCMAPRGIVAAAVASLFSFRLQSVFPEQYAQLVPIVFLVIVGTVVVYGLTISPLARWLGLARPNPQGLLIVGAHAWARSMGRVLRDLDFSVLIIDTNPQNIQQAREEGLLAERANALAEDVTEELDLAGLGHMVALTPNDEVNSLALLHFLEVFDSTNVYQLATRTERRRDREGDLPRHLRGHPLFGEEVTYGSLAERFSEGAEVRSFELSEEAPYKELEDFYENKMTPLFLARQGTLLIFSTEAELTPQPGDVLVAFVPALEEGKEHWPQAAAPRSVADAAEAEDGFEELVRHAAVLDLEDPMSYAAVVRAVAEELEGALPLLSASDMTGWFLEDARHHQTLVTRGVALPHYRGLEVEEARMALVRCTSGLCIEANPEAGQSGDGVAVFAEEASDEPVYALFFLVSPGRDPGQHLRTLSHLARIVGDDDFLDRWRAAEDEDAIKEALLQEAALPPAAEAQRGGAEEAREEVQASR